MKFNVFLQPLDAQTAQRSGIQIELRDAANGFVELYLTIPAAAPKSKPIERTLGLCHLSELEAAVAGVRVLTGGIRS